MTQHRTHACSDEPVPDLGLSEGLFMRARILCDMDGEDDGTESGAVGHGQPADGDGSEDGISSTATLAESHTEMTELLLPNDTNNLGRALGGAVLHWMDICGAIASMRFSGRQCVTASMDHVDFISPIDLGEVAVVEAFAFNTGRTSIDVKVDVWAENPRTGEDRETTTSFFTFVALDPDGRPTPVPELLCPTDEEKELRDRAVEERREQLESVADRLTG